MHLPPELLFIDDKYQFKSSAPQNIWSLGIIAHQIFADGQHPFITPNCQEWRRNVIEGKYVIDPVIPKESSIYLIIQRRNK